jgi:threonine/homoserine/homoserine lactone efflux protein
MAIGATATYAALARFPLNVVLMAALFGALGTVSALFWAWSGAGLRLLLRNARAVRAFNIAMALLLVASIYPVVFDLGG